MIRMEFDFTLEITENGMYVGDTLISKIKNRKGIVTVCNGSAGTGHSIHPNISRSGSLEGMISNGYWDKSDTFVKTKNWIFNTSRVVISDNLDVLAYLIQEYKLPVHLLTKPGHKVSITWNDVDDFDFNFRGEWVGFVIKTPDK